VLELLNKGEDAVLSIRNFGEKSMDELRDKLREKGFLRAPEAGAPEGNPETE
jgi:DNA-directed RNA polymerase subunit alpha